MQPGVFTVQEEGGATGEVLLSSGCSLRLFRVSRLRPRDPGGGSAPAAPRGQCNPLTYFHLQNSSRTECHPSPTHTQYLFVRRFLFSSLFLFPVSVPGVWEPTPPPPAPVPASILRLHETGLDPNSKSHWDLWRHPGYDPSSGRQENCPEALQIERSIPSVPTPHTFFLGWDDTGRLLHSGPSQGVLRSG